MNGWKKYGNINLEKAAKWFWLKVKRGKPNECWEWTACKNVDGYGYGHAATGVPVTAHRLSWVLHNGPFTDDSLVLHKCDNPPCVNPKHLFLGTQRDNVYDCIRKNRRAHLFGETHGRHKLTKREARMVKYLHTKRGVSNTVLGEWFGVTPTAIALIVKGKNWASA